MTLTTRLMKAFALTLQLVLALHGNPNVHDDTFIPRPRRQSTHVAR